MPVKRLVMLLVLSLLGCLLPQAALAAGAEAASQPAIDLTTSWVGFVVLALFIAAYVLVMLEDVTDLRKSKPVILAAGLIWMVIAAFVYCTGMDAPFKLALAHTLNEFAGLFLFLLVAMTYVNAMMERNIFGALRAWLAARGLSYRQLFWITGILAFFLSPAIDNMTTALVMSAVALAVGQGNKRFISLACINIVVAANAGGAFSPFGDITTLMVWHAGYFEFLEFFRLFVPAVANFVVPAAIMHWAIPRGRPVPDNSTAHVHRGGYAVVVAFAATVATAVIGRSVFGLPPYLGMMLGLAYLQFLMYYLMKTAPADAKTPQPGYEPGTTLSHGEDVNSASRFNVFDHVARSEWDTLLFFFGVLMCVGALSFVGYLALAADVLYVQWSATWANITVGVLSAIVDNIPIMASVIDMNPAMHEGQWLLVTLTAGVGGSLLSIGSAAGVALMGQARGYYTFVSHLKWTWAIAIGYAASIAVHMVVNAGSF